MIECVPRAFSGLVTLEANLERDCLEIRCERTGCRYFLSGLAVMNCPEFPPASTANTAEFMSWFRRNFLKSIYGVKRARP